MSQTFNPTSATGLAYSQGIAWARAPAPTTTAKQLPAGPSCQPCPACGGLNCLCRPRFFPGQCLTEDDLNRLTQYIVAKNQLHNRYLVGTGVVCGLDVSCSPCGNNLSVSAGYAIDTCGNDIIVCGDDSVDICLSSNVAEHVPRPWQLGGEMLRVTRPGGLVVLSYTVWLGPFGGHEMGLTHYLGGARAAARYARKHGHPAKNNYGSSLFAVSAAEGLDWAASTGTLIAAFPRYHPNWAWWLTAVPVVREFLVSNLVLVLQPQ